MVGGRRLTVCEKTEIKRSDPFLRDIYLIDFENVASEGLSGITYLDPEDQVVIFFSNNSKSLSMKMHILIGKSVCHLDYFEATVGGKNALDHQISTWLGYLVATKAADRNYYIVSRDAGYKYVASFWAESELKPNVRCVDSIKTAGRIERNNRLRQENAQRNEKTETEERESAAAPVETPVETAPTGNENPIPEEKREEWSRSRSRQGKNARNQKKPEKKAEKKPEENKAPKFPELGPMIAPYPGLQESHLRELIAENKKQALCNVLRKQLGQEKGLALYNEIKKSVWR